MVSGPVHFTGDYSLNFAWKGRKLMYDLLGVRTHLQFLKKLDSMATDGGEGTPDDVYEKIIYAGVHGKHPEVKLVQKEGDTEDSVYVADIIEMYFNDGNDLVKFDEIIIDAFVEAGLMNREQVKFSREIKKIRSRDDIKKILEKLDEAFGKAESLKELKKESVQVDDKGNQKTASTSLN